MARYGRIGMVARWKPVHNGQAPVLHALCRSSHAAVIGIGSSNRYDLRNPFTADETEAMIRAVLADEDGYEVVCVPDLDDGPRWRAMVRDVFGALDLFVTDNPYVASLLEGVYPLARPVTLVPEAERVPVEGTLVRREMARGGRWRELVPEPVATYITSLGLDERFRREFGLRTLALDAPG